MTNQSIAAREIPLALSNLPIIYSLLSHHSPRHPQPMPYIYFKMTHWGSRLCLVVLDASSLQWSERHLLPEQGEGTRRHLFKAGCFIRFQPLVFRKEPTFHKTPFRTSTRFFVQFGCLFRFFSQKRKAGLFCKEFSQEANY